MKIFFKIILWLCMITTVVVVVPVAIENWDEWSEIGKNFIDQLMTPDEPENDGDENDDTILTNSEGLAYEKNEEQTGYSVTGIGTCSDVVLVIPENYNGLPVIEIAEKAFYQNKQIVSVHIPKTVQKIGNKAFSECNNLNNITLPHKVELGIDVFRESIYVTIQIHHQLIFVPQKAPTCENAGNISHFWCENCNEFFADEKGTQKIYNVLISVTHSFENGVCADCGKILDEVKIVRIDTIPHLGTFALGTLENAIGLPESINAYTADGESHQLPVQWELTDYDKSKAGDYIIRGHIQAGNFFFANGISSEVETSISITEQMKGTADIVFVLDISGSMEDEINNVKNNIIAFATAIEEAGVSARWGAITYSDYLEYPSDPDEQTKIIENGASNWFSSAQEYKNAIGSISLANGGDMPETALDGLLLASTMTTRQDARVFYILLTDAETKTQNHYGVYGMQDCADTLNTYGVNISVITSLDLYNHYNPLYNTTGGIVTNIYDNFSQELLEKLIPIIYQEVIN